MFKPLRVVGLDMSLTSTGVSDGQSLHAFQTGPEDPIEHRLDHLVWKCSQFVMAPTLAEEWFPEDKAADLVVIEGPAYSRNSQTGHEELAALRYMMRVRLTHLKIPFAIVSPSALKSYTAGNGRATKQQMLAAMTVRHGLDLGHVKVKDGRYDMADGYALAAMGYDRVGQPIPSQGAPAPRKPLLSVDWPQLYSDN